MSKLDSPSFVLSALNHVSLQVHQEHAQNVCTTHQNIILLVGTLNCEVTGKDLVNKVVCDSSNHKCMMEEKVSDIDPDFQFHYSQ